jgi:hypothetical protein
MGRAWRYDSLYKYARMKIGIKKLLMFLKKYFLLRGTEFDFHECDGIPIFPRRHVLYILKDDYKYWLAVMICPCGCNCIIQLNLLPNSNPSWAVDKGINNKISVYPSIFRNRGCKSHFLLKKGRIIWC